ncbi:MAG: hypothetical protein ACREV8_02730, partial [Gammaproteobacteria bacterium]
PAGTARPSQRRRLMPKLIATMAVACAMLLTIAEMASAQQLRNSRGYYNLEYTQNTDGEQLDPLSLVWKGGAITTTMTETHVRNVIEDNWNAAQAGGPHPDRGRMTFGQVCLGQAASNTFGVHRGRQLVSFRREIGSPAREARRNDYQGSTSSRCLNQWHMRFWEDTHINEFIPGYGSPYQYAISGVHYDISTGRICIVATTAGCARVVGTGHRLPREQTVWNAARNHAVHRGMRHLCGRSRYKRRPGADRNFQGRRFDGWIGIIKYTYDGPNDQNCPKGLH